jgi:hypothetical protein
MPTFTGGAGAMTPATNNDNWNLDYGVTAGTFGKVIAIGWGGRLTSSGGYRTRWTRPTTAGSSTFNTCTLAFHQPNYVAAGGRLGINTATTAWNTAATLPADPAGNLWAQDWNAQGGVGVIVPPLANPWWIVNGVLQGQIACRNVAGTDVGLSSYEVTWEE